MSDAGWSAERPLRILHVEDDPAHAELVCRGFEDHPVANEICWVQTAAEALDILLEGNEPAPDVLLLDRRLPGDDGLEVLRRVRADPALADLPIAMLTSSQVEPERMPFYERWVDGYLIKPLDIGGFADILDELVRLVARRGAGP